MLTLNGAVVKLLLAYSLITAASPSTAVDDSAMLLTIHPELKTMFHVLELDSGNKDVFSNPNEVKTDLSIAQYRWSQVKDAPAYIDAMKFIVDYRNPYLEWAATFNREHVTRLKAQSAINFRYDAWYTSQISSFTYSSRCWQHIKYINYFRERNDVYGARQNLKLLKEHLGPELYDVNYLPPPIPTQWLKRFD